MRDLTRKLLVLFIACILFFGSSLVINNVTSIGEKVNLKSQSDRLYPIWNRTWGGIGEAKANSIAIDSTNIYVVGYVANNLTTFKDVLILKYDLNGNLVWNKTWGGTDDDVATSVAIDSTNIYVAGYTWSYGTESAAFVQKYDFNGNLLWCKVLNYGSFNASGANSVTLNGQYIYVAGFEWSIVSYGVGIDKALILKYNKNGDMLWNKTWGISSVNFAFSIAVDSTNLYVAGDTTNYTNGRDDVFILMCDSDGNPVWNRTWGGNLNDNALSIALNNTNIFVVGRTMSYSIGVGDVFLLKYDFNGNFLWNKTWGGAQDDWATSIKLDSTNIYVAGVTNCSGAGNGDVSILKYDLNGNLVWNKTWGGGGEDEAWSIAIDTAHIYITGYTNCSGAGNGEVLVLETNLDGGGGPLTPEFTWFIIPLGFILIFFMLFFRKKH